MRHLLIGAALAVLATCPLQAQGKGHGQGNAGGPGNAGHGPTMQGPTMQGPSMHGPKMRGPKMQGPSMQAAQHGNSGHGPKAKGPSMQASVQQRGNGHGQAKGHGNNAPARGPSMAEAPGHSGMAHGNKAAPAAAPHDNGNGHRPAVAAANDKGGIEVLQDGRHYYSARGARQTIDFVAARRGPIEGCPPGLAKKNNGCQPPGLAKQRAYQPAWWGYSNLAAAPYYYDDGYLVRMNGPAVASYLPLLGGALSVGNIWPAAYRPLPVPQYYVDYYDLGPVGGYRYADNVLYRVDPSTSAITSIAALLTGDTFNIGSPLPAGYDVYNVPYPYRSQYADGPDAWYRYSDGYIYEVDPTTQLIRAAIDLLAG